MLQNIRGFLKKTVRYCLFLSVVAVTDSVDNRWV